MSAEVFDEGLPEYASLLAARHAAHRDELRRLLQERWAGQNLDLLDVACGDGFYSATFDALLGPQSRIIALDLSRAFLKWASECRWEPGGLSPKVQCLVAEAERLPFVSGRFDLVWCAQSLVSLPRPLECLREMARLIRVGGMVAVLENDRLHEIQLPWPPDLELAIRKAERRAAPDSASAEKPHAGRFLERLMLDAGLQPVERVSVTIDRMSPLSTADEAFLLGYFHALIERTAATLEPAARQELLRLTSPTSSDYLPAQPTFWMTWSDVVVLSSRTSEVDGD